MLAAGITFVLFLGWQQNQDLEQTTADLQMAQADLAQAQTDLAKTQTRLALAVERNRQATTALCAEKHSLETEIHRTRALLDSDPGPIFGIPRSLIVQGLRDNEEKLEDYDVLECN